MEVYARTRREAEAHLEIEASATEHMQLCTRYMTHNAYSTTHVFHMPRRLPQEVITVALQGEVGLRIIVPVEAIVHKVFRAMSLCVVSRNKHRHGRCHAAIAKITIDGHNIRSHVEVFRHSIVEVYNIHTGGYLFSYATCGIHWLYMCKRSRRAFTTNESHLVSKTAQGAPQRVNNAFGTSV